MLSIIIPVLNEEESLRELLSQIQAACQSVSEPFEVIFIDDGSTDGSWNVIYELCDAENNVKGIRFRRNFGKAAAIQAGIKSAKGDLLMMMDADLQDDPSEIPRFLQTIREEECDFVNGWKEKRLDPWHKVYPSRVFNWMISKLTGLKLHDHNCGFKLFTREVSQEIRLYGERHRFIPVLAHARGFRVKEMTVHHRPRQFGTSNYGFKRFQRGLLDLLTVSFLISYGQRPQHSLGAIGLFSFGLGMLGLGYLAVLWVLMNVAGVLTVEPIGTRPLLAYSVMLTLLGAQVITLGLLAELIVSNAEPSQPIYSIREQIPSSS